MKILSRRFARGLASSRRPEGFSRPGDAAETDFSESVLDDYCSGDPVRAGIAAFRLRSFLGAKQHAPVNPEISGKIASALLGRLRAQPDHLGGSDLEIGVILWLQRELKSTDIETLVEYLQGRHDMAVAGLASQLIPIIGTAFLSGYLSSSVLFETGGMGGPTRPLLREMAQEALAAFNRK
jgi:hypothetical protein